MGHGLKSDRAPSGARCFQAGLRCRPSALNVPFFQSCPVAGGTREAINALLSWTTGAYQQGASGVRISWLLRLGRTCWPWHEAWCKARLMDERALLWV